MIQIVKVNSRDEGNLKAHEILQTIIDKEKLLVLSGGTSPDYRKMIVEPALLPFNSPTGYAAQTEFLPGAICLADERSGLPYHEHSNELILKQQGIEELAQTKKIEYQRILTGGGLEQTAHDYDIAMGFLFSRFAKRVGIMGIGSNLHTAGIFPHSKALISNSLVVGEVVNDDFPRRITITMKALDTFQYFIILAFGAEKKEPLLKVLDENENDLSSYPAIFYRKCYAKAYLITDQEIR